MIKLTTSDGKTVDGYMWPLGVAAVPGGIPSVSSWRQWGHSWAAQGYDERGLEVSRTRSSERIAGMMHLPPHAVRNEARSGAAVTDALDPGGFGHVLQACMPASSHQQWPWEVDRFGVEAGLWGVNDIGAGRAQGNAGLHWNGQGAMWLLVWQNTVRSVITRFLAGAVYAPMPGSGGLYPAVWNYNGTTMVANFAMVQLGPAGGGASHWQYKLDRRCNTSDGYWWTDQAGDRIVITVPADYDTGTIGIRHLCPGSWYDPAWEIRDALGVPNPVAPPPPAQANTPWRWILTGTEHPLAPSAVTVVGGNINATVNCQGLANRTDDAKLNGVNPGGGVIGANSAMTHVSRHGLTPSIGNNQTITITVGGLPAGGWYGFDSWEIEARPDLRPIVIMANVADPDSWATIYGFAPAATVWPLVSTRAQEFSDTLAAVVAEYADPGVMVADIRTKIATHPHDYAILRDNAAAIGNFNLGQPVPLSSMSTKNDSGDGTHPHGLGNHLIVEAHLEALANAVLTKGRGAIPFAPARSLGYGRSSG